MERNVDKMILEWIVFQDHTIYTYTHISHIYFFTKSTSLFTFLLDSNAYSYIYYEWMPNIDLLEKWRGKKIKCHEMNVACRTIGNMGKSKQ